MQSKAKTINSLQSLVRCFKIPPTYIFITKDWLADKAAILDEIQKRFSDCQLLAIRSSASDEDDFAKSRAGEYDSVLNVPCNNPKAIGIAVDKVIASYQRNGPRSDEDEVIVQRMVQDCIMSGVVFTHDLNTGAPYYVVNYDDISGLTDTVTSGDSEYANRTLYIHRNSTQELRSKRFQILLKAIGELEQIMDSQFLDVEFAITEDLQPYLLQVRAITTRPNWNRAITKHVDITLKGAQAFVKKKFNPIDGVFGETTVFGQMPDWNPVEMIGRVPRALAFSLYKNLITDHAWRIARRTMGYAVPNGHPLMVSIAGQPFIDTRLSFHSFLPDGLESEICEKLVNSWVRKLREFPELHDKIEFDIAITTFSFDIDDKINSPSYTALSQKEKKAFKEALRKQTVALFNDQHPGSIKNSLLKIECLKSKQAHYQNQPELQDLSQLFSMQEDCIMLGTIPFSILARHGFIARTLLLSLVSRGILTMDHMHHIQTGIRTVASDLVDDMRRLQLGEIEREMFMNRYGHLRPGTYDILSKRYDQMPDLGVVNSNAPITQRKGGFKLSSSQKKAIDRLLLSEGFSGIDADRFFDYIREATCGREYGKFIFSRSISYMLEMIAGFGEYHGLSREELSYIALNDLLQVSVNSIEGSVEDWLRLIAETNKAKHSISTAIRLPQVLFDEAGVHIVPFQVSNPNFITTKKITGPCFLLKSDQSGITLTGKIVLIENADPGFDWIFSHSISGLITKYGGANSHMAIRCAEFGIPAAIGCGEQRFEALARANQIMLDCSTSLIKKIH